MISETTTLYTCEICGKQSMDKDKIINCEAQGYETPLVKVGDRVLFRDTAKRLVLEECFNQKLIEHILNYTNGLENEYEFTVTKIKQNHKTYYWLDNEKWIFGESKKSLEGVFIYPLIRGNKDFALRCAIV